jgi:hypothetical protein
VHFIFDGGELDDDVPIELQDSELDDYRFVEPGDLAGYLPPIIAARVTAALRSRAAGGAGAAGGADGAAGGTGGAGGAGGAAYLPQALGHASGLAPGVAPGVAPP